MYHSVLANRRLKKQFTIFEPILAVLDHFHRAKNDRSCQVSDHYLCVLKNRNYRFSFLIISKDFSVCDFSSLSNCLLVYGEATLGSDPVAPFQSGQSHGTDELGGNVVQGLSHREPGR